MRRRQKRLDRGVLQEPVEAQNTTNLERTMVPRHVRCQGVPDEGASDEALSAFLTQRRLECGVCLDGGSSHGDS